MTRPVAVFCVTTPMSIPLFGNRFHLLVEAGIDLHIIVGEPITESIPELPTEAKVHVVPMTRSINPIGDLIALAKMVKLQRRLRPKLVAAATPKASLIGLLAARITRVPARVWEVWGARWDGPPTRITSLLMTIDRFIAGSSTRIVAVSQSLAELLATQRIGTGKPEVVGFGSTKGVDTDIFHPSIDQRSDRRPTIGFVGRLSTDKGIDDVITVARAARDKIPNLCLLLVGQLDRSDPPSPEVVSEIGSETWITCTGWVQDTSEYYRSMDLLLFPSIREGLPNVLLEALASGVPVVAFEVTGVIDVLRSSTNDYLLSPGDLRSMTAATLSLLQGRSRVRNRPSSGRAEIVQRFDRPMVERQWTKYYLGLL